MSIVLVTFPAAPTVSEDALQKEMELESSLKKNVIGEYTGSELLLSHLDRQAHRSSM